MNDNKRPGSGSAVEIWLNGLPQTSMDPREYLKYAFEEGYQRGYDKALHGDPSCCSNHDEALDELQVADIPGLSHASVEFSVNENGDFQQNDFITLYVMDDWCDESMERALRICWSHGCECKIDGK
jgi:hypothetical protein